MQLSILQWLIQGIPECISYAMLAWILLNNKFLFNKILVIGVVQAFVMFIFRFLPLPFGLHSLVGVISLSVLLTAFVKTRYSTALVVSLLVIVFLGVLELILVPLQAKLLHVTHDVLFTDPLLASYAGWPQVLIIFIVSFLIYCFKKKR